MPGKFFLDTNVFVYSLDFEDPRKRGIALELIREAAIDGRGAVSYQVVQEFLNVTLAKSPRRFTSETARHYVDKVFRPLVTIPSSLELVFEAIRIQERYRIGWYDSLIVAGAIRGGCHTLLTEDLQHNQRFESVLVRNPFV